MILRTLRKMLDAPRIRDTLSYVGGSRMPKQGGITMAAGSPVTVEHVLSTFGCSQEYAENFVRRHT